MKGVSESMAGRAAVFGLLPLSQEETPKVTLARGGFPEVLAKPALAATWFRSYIQTYLERDVRQIAAIHDLAIFRRFLSLLASRSGQILNRTDFASSLGVTIPTISAWIGILETTNQILLVPPYFENFGKRLIKSPKLYFMDSGLACHLLGLESERSLRQSVFHGQVFEGFVAAEIVKHQINHGREKQLYFFRDQQGLEIDFIIPLPGRKLALVETKASRTAMPKMAQGIRRLLQNVSGPVSGHLIYQPAGGDDEALSLGTGVTARSLGGFCKNILPK